MKKSTISSILTIDNYNGSVYKFKGNRAQRVSRLKRSASDSVVSYIANRDLIIEMIELSSSISSEHLADVITDKAYEELRLDTAIEYNVYPVKTAIKSQNSKYQTIIADVKDIKNSFSDIAKKVKYIDYLLPAPLLYKVLYNSNNLDSSSTDMFLYFGDYDTFVTFYHRGELLYSKSINYSLNHIYDRFCQILKEVPLTREQFRELLSNSGLRTENKQYREVLIKIFNECFLTINDIVIYLKRSYEITKVKKAFVGFSWGYTDGIEAFFKNYVDITPKPTVLAYSKEDPKAAVDPIHSLMKMSAEALSRGSIDIPNLTPYPKPLPFAKRPAGQMIMAFTLISLLGLAPSAYQYVIALRYKAENSILSPKVTKLKQDETHYKNLLKQKDERINALSKQIKMLAKEYAKRKGEITEVYNKKFSYKLRSEQLTLLTDVLTKHGILTRDIKIDGNRYYIDVEANSDKEITTFVKDVVKNFNTTIKSVNIDDIIYDKKEKIYKGTLEVEFYEGGM